MFVSTCYIAGTKIFFEKRIEREREREREREERNFESFVSSHKSLVSGKIFEYVIIEKYS